LIIINTQIISGYVIDLSYSIIYLFIVICGQLKYLSRLIEGVNRNHTILKRINRLCFFIGGLKKEKAITLNMNFNTKIVSSKTSLMRLLVKFSFLHFLIDA